MMRRSVILLLSGLFCCSISAQQHKYSRQEYIEMYKDAAIASMRTHGIPASITLAQGCLESADGNSPLAVEALNHFGIKCHTDWKGPTYMRQDDEKGKSCFRVYKSVQDSYNDHADFLRYRDRYAFLFDIPLSDYKSWCYGLKKAGYATDPKYAERLIKIIEEYKLYQDDSLNVPAILLPSAPAELEKSTRLEPASASRLYNLSSDRTIYIRNRVAFVISNTGDSYESIAAEYHLFSREILRFNDLKEKTELAPGTVVYIQKKRTRTPRGLTMHIAEKGDTYRGIAQRYGVQLKSIQKYNNLGKGDISPKEGEQVLLRPVR